MFDGIFCFYVCKQIYSISCERFVRCFPYSVHILRLFCRESSVAMTKLLPSFEYMHCISANKCCCMRLWEHARVWVHWKLVSKKSPLECVCESISQHDLLPITTVLFTRFCYSLAHIILLLCRLLLLHAVRSAVCTIICWCCCCRSLFSHSSAVILRSYDIL